jgi:hypothetical protein
MSPVVRRAIVLLAVLVAGACSGAATEPRPNRHPTAAVPHFDGTDTTNRSGLTSPHG